MVGARLAVQARRLQVRPLPLATFMRESTVEQYLKTQTEARKGEVRKVVWQGRRGAPDRLVMLPVTTGFPPTFVELKAPGKSPRIAQEREFLKMRSLGCRVVVIDSFEGVDKLLEGI